MKRTLKVCLSIISAIILAVMPIYVSYASPLDINITVNNIPYAGDNVADSRSKIEVTTDSDEVTVDRASVDWKDGAGDVVGDTKFKEGDYRLEFYVEETGSHSGQNYAIYYNGQRATGNYNIGFSIPLKILGRPVVVQSSKVSEKSVEEIIKEEWEKRNTLFNNAAKEVNAGKAENRVATLDLTKASGLTWMPMNIWMSLSDANGITDTTFVIHYIYMGQKRTLIVPRGTNINLLKDESGNVGGFEFIATKMGVNTLAQ